MQLIGVGAWIGVTDVGWIRMDPKDPKLVKLRGGLQKYSRDEYFCII